MSAPQARLTDSGDWKDRYYEVLKELDAREKNWAAAEGGLYKSILRLILSYTGMDAELDQQLADMRDSLRRESDNHARQAIINPLIETIVAYGKKRNADEQLDHAAQLQYLLDKLDLSGPSQQALADLNGKLATASDRASCIRYLDEIIELISAVARDAAPAGPGAHAKDDSLLQLLEQLSLPGEAGIEVLGLRRRAAEIAEEQDRLQLIQDLVALLSTESGQRTDGESSIEDITELKNCLLELFEWLSIPGEYSTRIELVKTRIHELNDHPGLSAVLRDTALVINDLQESLQVEMGDIQGFLARVTARLEDVEEHFQYMLDLDSDDSSDARRFNEHLADNVKEIRSGIVDSEDVNEIKQAIEKRLVFIEQSTAAYFDAMQKRRHRYEDKVTALRERVKKMKGESLKLHKRIIEEFRKAKTDALTGIANRLAYNEKLKQEIKRWQRNNQPFSICVIDVDKFKGVNDTYGHKAGDRVLKTIAEVCSGKVRESDFFARYGGEEFVLLLPETSIEQARLVADNLRKEVQTCKFHYSKKPVAITISCGVTEFNSKDTPDSFFSRADKALYRAKNEGRNRVVVA